MLVAKSAVPDRSIDHEEADRIVIVALFQIPAVARVIGGDPKQVALEQVVVNLVPLRFCLPQFCRQFIRQQGSVSVSM